MTEPISILRVPQVAARTGLSRATIYRMQKLGTFPHCVRVTPNTAGWLEAEVTQWLADRIAASRSVPAKA